MPNSSLHYICPVLAHFWSPLCACGMLDRVLANLTKFIEPLWSTRLLLIVDMHKKCVGAGETPSAKMCLHFFIITELKNCIRMIFNQAVKLFEAAQMDDWNRLHRQSTKNRPRRFLVDWFYLVNILRIRYCINSKNYRYLGNFLIFVKIFRI